MKQSRERRAEKECLERCAGSGERVLRAKSGACRAEKESLERRAARKGKGFEKDFCPIDSSN